MEKVRVFPQSGDVLNQYRLLEKLGEGGFAVAFKALNTSNNQVVALKALTRLQSEDLKLFSEEAYRMMGLDHPHLVKFRDYVEWNQPPYIVMDLARMGSLQSELRRREQAGDWLPPRRSVTVLEQAGAALLFLHGKKLIHRDVKPPNILLASLAEAWLSDLGISQQLHTTNSLETGHFAGTIHYAAPEQIRGKPKAKSDLYALGVTAYLLFTGKLPFTGNIFVVMNQHLTEPPPDPLVMAQDLLDKGIVNPKIIQAVTPVILQALKKDPDKRPENSVFFTRKLRDAYNQATEEKPDKKVFAHAKTEIPPSQAETVISPEQQKIQIIWELFQKGLSFSNKNRYQEALEVYNLILQHDPNNIYARLNRGDALINLKQYTGAIEAFDHVLTLDPRNIHALNLKGMAYGRSKRYKEAIAAYDQAIGINPAFKDAHNNKGVALHALGKYSAAIAAYDQAIAIDPRYSLAYLNKGIALDATWRTHDAIRAYDLAIQHNPWNIDAYKNKAKTILLFGKLEDRVAAIAVYEQMIQLNLADSEAFIDMGNVYVVLKQAQNALRAFDQAIRVSPNNSVAYYNKGIVLEGIELYDQAVAAFTKAGELNPSDKDAKAKLEKLQRRIQRKKKPGIFTDFSI
jgi:serine/threonine protein kinase